MAQSTQSTASIPAAPGAVLDVIAELPDYPRWAAGIREVEVLSEDDGWPLTARFTVDQAPIRDSYVLRYTWDVDETGAGLVSWTLAEAGTVITGLDGSYEFAATAAGTDVTYRLTVDVRMPMPGPVKRKAEQRIVRTALDDLTAEVGRG